MLQISEYPLDALLDHPPAVGEIQSILGWFLPWAPRPSLDDRLGILRPLIGRLLPGRPEPTNHVARAG